MQIPLGKSVRQPESYQPEILAPIPRSLGREKSKIDPESFVGLDRWAAYEFAWHDKAGRLQVGILDIVIAADSLHLVESKSLKLYLNSCYFSVFEHLEVMEEEVSCCLADCVQGQVSVKFIPLRQAELDFAPVSAPGECIDQEVVDDGGLHTLTGDRVHEQLHSHLFRSLCPVTAQPDWASILVEYRGQALSRPALLAYLRRYADHQGFHENCVETIYRDILALQGIDELAVCAKFLRRGGIDICPFRTSTSDFKEPSGRLVRQ